MNTTLIDFNRLVEAFLQEEKENPISKHIPVDQLYQTLDLSLNDDPINEEAFTEAIKTLVLKSTKTATNTYFNQLFGGRNEKAVLGDLLAVVLNNSMYTYKAAGPQIGVEKVIIEKICAMIGWGIHANGTIAPGGSMTNFMSMVLARDVKNHKAPYEGTPANMTIYTSEDSHYSIPKNASFSGIGRNNVRYIPVDDSGKMKTAALNKAIKEDITNGLTPTLVNATAGTTVLGVFDDVLAISKLCKKYDVWLHVDGAYCGSVIFSNQYKHLLKGLEEADSFSFNAHKMIGTPLTCSLLFVKNREHLYNSFSNDASYLYQTDHDDYNLGKTSLQCGRRNDALKFWTLWKSVGTKGLETIVNTQFELADIARNYINNHSDYTLYSFEDSISICFNYKDISARKICTLLYENAALLVGYGTFKNQEFIRLVTINAQNKPEDILHFFHTLEKFIAENKQLF